ncbi:hypothetical protein [Paenibacillus senegalensis]|uniref:hypothetical protein n=1 Tax=Paenibacillus senegalensis TaxID=1465766 RepID=UPI0002D49815|nr:hypothetical protein [Paenibacillus senegalensis]
MLEVGYPCGYRKYEAKGDPGLPIDRTGKGQLNFHQNGSLIEATAHGTRASGMAEED